MSFTQIDLDKSTVFGSGNINRVSTPYITASIRRKNPDMSSTVPYYSGLNTTTITVVQAGTFSGTTVITFTADSYAQALTDINTAGVGNFIGVDVNGYLTIKSSYSGDRNSIKITGGSALSILGMDAFPHPGGVSYAGEIASVTPNVYEGRSKGEGITIQNEALNRENLNRGLAAVGYILDTLNVNLDREIAVPREFDVTINGSSFSISSDERVYVNAGNISVSQPSSDQIDNVACILDSFHNQLFSSTGDRVRVTSITYGTLVNATQSFASWGTADGKQVFGALSHFQKVKGTYTIQSISGNTITVTGSLTGDKVQPNDTITISGATNLSPFNHNGEFLVDKILSSTILQVRPKGVNDFNLLSSPTPSSLNQAIGPAEVYGTVTAYVGKFIPLTMKSGNMIFNLSSSLPNGTYKVRLAVGRTLKQLLQEDMTAASVISPFGGQIELGSKFIATLANALKPRIISKPNGDVDKTLFAEFYNTAVSTVGTRIYLDKTGGLELVYNGKWDGAVYNKDDGSKDIVYIKEDGIAVFLGTSTFSTTLDYINSIATIGSSTMYLKLDEVANTAEVTRGNQKLLIEDAGGTVSAKMTNSFDIKDQTTTVLSVPDFDGLITSQINSKPGIKLGTGFTTDAQHLIEKVNYNCNTTSTKYTLISETNLALGKKREYMIADGSSITTINAKWNGTQWVKDVTTGNFSSGKFIIDPVLLDYKIFKHIVNTSPFNDTDWANYKIPYSLTATQDATLNNVIPIFIEEFTASSPSKYLFDLTSSTNSAFTTASTGEVECFGAAKWNLTASSSTWNLAGLGAFLQINSRNFVMRYKFKLRTITLFDVAGSLTSSYIGVNALSSNALVIKFSDSSPNFFYTVDAASTDSGVAYLANVWYTVEWQRDNAQLYLSISDGTTKTQLISGAADVANREFQPNFIINCKDPTGLMYPQTIFLIDYFEIYKY